MRVNVILENAEYGKFSNIKLCYNIDRDGNIVEEQVPLTFGEYERIYDFITVQHLLNLIFYSFLQ